MKKGSKNKKTNIKIINKGKNVKDIVKEYACCKKTQRRITIID